MFLDNLSVSLLKICDTEHLSYEKASERCSCCSKHFANIIYRRSAPSLTVFEQICLGFHETPNHLLGVEVEEASFRTALPVVEARRVSSGTGAALFPICPRCGSSLEREYQAYCDRCGQCLAWQHFHAAIITPRP